MKIGPYDVLGELGRGGMGVVYRVRAPDGRDAALKLLLRADAATLARFEREKRLLASLGEEHGFVGLLASGSSGAGTWLLMPLVAGGTLRKRLEAGPLAVEETVALGVQLASALGRAHERGIVHRDVKPENVLFTSDGRPLLADLGLAKHFDRGAECASQSLSLSAHGVLKGTAGYMAPEQVEDAKIVGPPADVFALGAILYECLAGRPAVAGDSVVELLAKVSSGVVEPIGRLDVPPWLEGVVQRALTRDPLERFPEGGSLARALRSVREAPTAVAKRSRVVPLAVGSGVGAIALAVVGGFLHRPRPETPRAERPLGGAPPSVASAKGEPGRPERPSLRAKELYELALEKDRASDSLGEIVDLTKVIDLDPSLAGAWAQRGVVRGAMGDVDGAIADLTKAIELDPKLALAWANRGVVWGNKGDPEREIADETKAIELDPANAQSSYNRAVARAQKGDLDGAIADGTKALELDPEFARAWFDRGAARARKGDLDGAIADETKAIDLAPELALAWFDRGVARARKGDLDRAKADLDHFLERAPTDSMAPRARRELADLEAKRPH